MTRETMLKIMDIQENTWNDPITKALSAELAQRNTQFLSAVETMTPEQKEAVFDYMGCLIELQNQFLIYTVEKYLP